MRWLGGVTVWLAAVAAAAGQGQDLKARYEALVKDYNQAEAEFQKAYVAAKTPADQQKIVQEKFPKPEVWVPRMLAIAEAAPKEALGLDALLWILAHGGIQNDANGEKTVQLLTAHHLQSDRLALACRYLEDDDNPAAPKLLRSILERNPHRAVKGQACLSLAVVLLKAGFEAEAAKPAEATPLFKEGQDRLTEVQGQYADVKIEGPVQPDEPTTLGEAARLIALDFRLRPGQPAPAVAGKDLAGADLRLSDFRGKVVALAFWSPQNPEALALATHLRDLGKQLAGKPFAVVGVTDATEDAAALQAKIAPLQIPWRTVRDSQAAQAGKISAAWNVRHWPTLYLVDGLGVIRQRWVGRPPEQELDAAVQALLQGGK